MIKRSFTVQDMRLIKKSFIRKMVRISNTKEKVFTFKGSGMIYLDNLTKILVDKGVYN